jgi:hypothetical protein
MNIGNIYYISVNTTLFPAGGVDPLVYVENVPKVHGGIMVTKNPT